MNHVFKSALLLLIATYGLAGAAASVEGEWELRSRICGVGLNKKVPVPPTDRFVMGRDQMVLSLRGGAAESRMTIEGQRFVETLALNQTEQYIDSVRTAVYRLEQDGSLTVLSGDFGDGGSCPVGATLFSNFIRLR